MKSDARLAVAGDKPPDIEYLEDRCDQAVAEQVPLSIHQQIEACHPSACPDWWWAVGVEALLQIA
jgi:hypothetical protein